MYQKPYEEPTEDRQSELCNSLTDYVDVSTDDLMYNIRYILSYDDYQWLNDNYEVIIKVQCKENKDDIR